MGALPPSFGLPYSLSESEREAERTINTNFCFDCRQNITKAIPHKDCRADAPSDCPKRRRNTGVFQGVLGKNDGKDASVCAAKRVARSLRGVAHSLQSKQNYTINTNIGLKSHFIHFLNRYWYNRFASICLSFCCIVIVSNINLNPFSSSFSLKQSVLRHFFAEHTVSEKIVQKNSRQ